MGAGCPERFDWEFMKYVWNFRRTNAARMEALLSAAGAAVFRVKTRRALKRLTDDLLK